MAKRLIEVAPAMAGRAANRAPAALGPGIIRLAEGEQDENSAEIYIYGDIGGWWGGVDAEVLAKEIAALDVETINVRINSPGGLVFGGIAIYNALARHKAKVIVHIDSLAASIASVIAMAGDEIRIAESAHIMIHKPWSGVIGDSDTMRLEADILDTLESAIIDTYEARTEQDRGELEAWVAAETWFKGKDAVDHGFADVLVPSKKKAKAAAGSALLAYFQRTPKELLPEGASDPAVREIERLLREGEGFSNAHAKRLASAVMRITGPHRDGAGQQPTDTLRDEGEDQEALEGLSQLAATIRSTLNK
ncbi:head maturation protease, ClpP-related [Nisaea sediminum]|uniref:head maturation protease, ClpP-related n=1 Tax=Nisaea sediminum TaxID=2775867 RepID=UPI001D020F9F|nr:head maturation protease, ClpP-related [Nisaea sediminum]